jgi:hypothetical protein
MEIEKQTMKNLSEVQEVFMDDIMYLPIQYHNNVIDQPYFQGRGQLNVTQLENLCEKFMEYTHQQAVIKQGLKQIVISQMFNIPLVELREES